MSNKGAADAEPAETAPVFAALGDATRLRLVARLSGDGPQSIARLANGEAVSRQAITKHLRALESAGLARSSKVGRERVWKLRRKKLVEARRYLRRISDRWDEALERLRVFVESEQR